ncbi:TetR/AcrR family transcriptional regulator [Reyranella sp.]|uniref:TetR/AcrR family transcriptional regulator n=1 Tax=Reyranella sp. TaxID=1929291 RepID=UPI0037834A23
MRPVYPEADARNSIMEAAIAVLAERGFHGTTMRDIAQRAGVSQGLLHHHFGTKEKLWRTAGEHLSNDFMAYVAEVLKPDAPPSEAIPRAMRTYLRYWREHPEAFRFNLWRLVDGPADERAQRSQVLNARSVPLMQRGQEEGFIRSDIPAGLTLIIAGALIQFWLHSQVEIRDALAVTGDEVPADDMFLKLVLDLVRARPETKARPKNPRRKRHER